MGESEYQKMCREAGKSKKEGKAPYGANTQRQTKINKTLSNKVNALEIKVQNLQKTQKDFYQSLGTIKQLEERITLLERYVLAQQIQELI